jgi:hypothetical protein
MTKSGNYHKNRAWEILESNFDIHVNKIRHLSKYVVILRYSEGSQSIPRVVLRFFDWTQNDARKHYFKK